MITEIPTPDEFAAAGVNLLNLAWAIGIDIAGELEDAEDYGADLDREQTKEFWKLAQPTLANGFTLVQQAQEMALKGRIAAVSPYLLISSVARDWPSGSAKQDISFAKFRTPDAADLIKILHTVCASNERLPGAFEEFFETTRVQRNAIVHTGGIGRHVEVSELVVGVLRTARDLFPSESWPQRRRAYCDNDRLAVTFSSDYVGHQVLREFATATRILRPAERKEFFGLTKARRYSCPQCRSDAKDLDEVISLAQLHPNSPGATKVHCFVCGTTVQVERVNCTTTDCPSNVICADADFDRECLVCCRGQD